MPLDGGVPSIEQYNPAEAGWPHFVFYPETDPDAQSRLEKIYTALRENPTFYRENLRLYVQNPQHIHTIHTAPTWKQLTEPGPGSLIGEFSFDRATRDIIDNDTAYRNISRRGGDPLHTAREKRGRALEVFLDEILRINCTIGWISLASAA